MEMHQCSTMGELTTRMRTSANITAWIAYLELKDKMEQEKINRLLGEAD